ncbi:MAG: insulinase family protein [Rhodospirillaceae bacterium]|nr:insulinase family protein [Rhodospirillaceae bacterium]MBT3928888.1 insulinase family protein [Rhodospirillaceae bacterium]MBT4427037.1 insulinase family protein [Rhodospirillaceae bacterium]MBT5676073.1 insulinase family protein [Rhodospirillaceae bacterium]MBT6828594.1 insulinase family protein [Rhodospirillaceae bacterium]
MIRSFLALCCFLVAASVFSAVRADEPIARVQRVISPSGIEIWYVQEANIPVISLSLGFRGGTVLDPPGKAGLANFALGLLNEGAGELDALAFQKAVIDRAIHLNSNASRDLVTVSLQTLSRNRDEAFKLLGMALSEARFEAPPVERVRSQILNILADEARNPRTIASRTWFGDIFADHPYAQRANGTEETIRAITPADLKNWTKARFARDNLIVGASGDVAPEEIARLVDIALAGLAAHAAVATVPEAVFPASGATQVVRMPLMQSVVVFGMPGLKRDDADFYAAYVMNYILGGGGFTSRLYEEVREKRGLAYSVYSYLAPLQHAGLYMGGVATRNDGVAQTLDIIRAEIAHLAESGVSTEELSAAKQYLTGAFPLRLDSGGKVAGILVQMQFESLGIDYLDRRNGYMEAVTMADIVRVAKRLLNPERLRVVVVGDPEGLQDS